MKISDLKIGARLGAAFGAVLLLMSAMIVLGVWELSRAAEAKDVMRMAGKTEALAAKWLEGIATNSVRTYAKAKSTSTEDQKYFDDQMKEVSARVSAIQKELEPHIQGEEAKHLFADVADKRKIYSDIRANLFKLKEGGQSNEADLSNMAATKMLPAMNVYVDSVKKLAEYQESLVEKADKSIDALYSEAKMLLLSLGGAAFSLGALLAWMLSGSITRPLSKAVKLAQTVAAGDLTTKIDVSSRDEVGQLLAALKQMNANLLKTVAEVRTGTDTIATASQQIAAGNMDLSSRTEEQASSLEETASSMEELTSTVKQNADNARQANRKRSINTPLMVRA